MQPDIDYYYFEGEDKEDKNNYHLVDKESRKNFYFYGEVPGLVDEYGKPLTGYTILAKEIEGGTLYIYSYTQSQWLKAGSLSADPNLDVMVGKFVEGTYQQAFSYGSQKISPTGTYLVVEDFNTEENNKTKLPCFWKETESQGTGG